MGTSTSTSTAAKREATISKRVESSDEPLVLALNAGSSSLKASVLQGSTTILSFLSERLNTKDSVINIQIGDEDDEVLVEKSDMDNATALDHIINFLKDHNVMPKLTAIGHRVVHGGTAFTESAIMDDESLEKLKSVTRLAPLHNPHNLEGIETMRNSEYDVPNVAVFDTTFHSTLPAKAYTYPLPAAYRDRDMRKYGFHGTSVHFVSQQVNSVLDKIKPDTNFHMIVCHLGSGASVTAVSENRSVETSMGFTPLAGLMMGSRCGDVDPSLVQYACHELDMSVDDVLKDLNKKSGLKGMVSDGQTDMRELIKRMRDGDDESALAVDMFVYRLAQHIASSMVALKGPLDALVFTAGIGEHSSDIRKMTMDQLKNVLPNVTIDKDRNQNDGADTDGILSPEGQWPVVLDIATDEEAMIAKECLRLVGDNKTAKE